MGEIIFYKPNGTVKNAVAIIKENLALCNGMKLKCYLKNGSKIIGFADVYRIHNQSEYDNEIHDYIYLWTFDNLDEEQHKLIGSDDKKYNMTFNKVNIDDIIQIEAILYSNPRWGTTLTNKFQFSK